MQLKATQRNNTIEMSPLGCIALSSVFSMEITQEWLDLHSKQWTTFSFWFSFYSKSRYIDYFENIGNYSIENESHRQKCQFAFSIRSIGFLKRKEVTVFLPVVFAKSQLRLWMIYTWQERVHCVVRWIRWKCNSIHNLVEFKLNNLLMAATGAVGLFLCEKKKQFLFTTPQHICSE